MKVQRSQLKVVVGAAAVAGVLAVVGLTGFGGTASAGTDVSGTARTVTATAEGSATGVPDQLTANVGISNDGVSAANVLAENNQKTAALIDRLKKAGIDAKDITTTSVNLGPRYDDSGDINGYRADNSLRITLHDLKTAGARLDDVVQVGGDSARVQSVSLGFNEDDALLSKARVDAVKRAQTQATEMAKAAGAQIGAVRTITDVVVNSSVPYEYKASASGAADSSVPVEPGSQDLTVQVRVVYELRS